MICKPLTHKTWTTQEWLYTRSKQKGTNNDLQGTMTYTAQWLTRHNDLQGTMTYKEQWHIGHNDLQGTMAYKAQ